MTTTIGDVPISPGQRFSVAEDDYLYGSGRARIIVREVLGVMQREDGAWVELRADEIMANGTGIPREITIRLDALRAATDRKAS